MQSDGQIRRRAFEQELAPDNRARHGPGRARAAPAALAGEANVRARSGTMRTIVILGVLLAATSGWAECGKAPYSIIWADGYKDGGTIGVAVTDSIGCVVEFCIDGRLSSGSQGAIYLNGRHPSEADQQPLGTVEARELMGLVKRVLDAQFTAAEQDSIYDSNFLAGDRTEIRHARILLHTYEREKYRYR